MLDTLFGRAALKENIEDLEQELADCEAEYEAVEERLDKESTRRKTAVTERQEAQRQANKLEDKIEQLEDKIDRLQSEETSLHYRGEASLRGSRLEAVLSRLESFETDQEGALTAAVDDGHDLPRAVREAFGDRAALVSRAAPCVALTDDVGLVSACLRAPVTPDPFAEWDDRFQFDRDWFQPRGRYTLALVRSDIFAMGTYVGDEQLSFYGFDSELKSKHSKGGFSQARFERLREEQIDDHLGRCEATLEERETDLLYVVGEGSVLGAVSHLADATATVDATGPPEEALEDAWRDFWTVRLRIL